MVRTEKQKQSQKEWRLRNRDRCNAINLASRKRRYNEVGKVYQETYYAKNRNYIGVNNMGKHLNELFREV